MKPLAYVNPLKSRWAQQGTVFGGWLMSNDVLVAETIAGCGLDEVCVDLQHSIVEQKDLAGLFMAIAGAGSTPTARVATNDFTQIGNVLDLGALGVIIPMVNGAEEAAQAVAACRYPPHGRRSSGAIRNPTGSNDPRDVENVACIVMVETSDGLANCEAIAKTPGVDCVYIGPGDLALTLGVPRWNRNPSEQAAFDQAVDRVKAACDAAGVVAGMYCVDGSVALQYRKRGFRYLTVATDLTLVARAREDLNIASGRGLETAR